MTEPKDPLHTERDIYVNDVTSGCPVIRFERQGQPGVTIRMTSEAAGHLAHALACCDRIGQVTGWGRIGPLDPHPDTTGSLAEAVRAARGPDCHAILIGYIQIVGDAEGVDFIPSEGEATPHLSPDQCRILRELAKSTVTG